MAVSVRIFALSISHGTNETSSIPFLRLRHAGVDDPLNPYNNSAQAQSYTPPLNQPWDYSTDRVQGVNLGGWLVLEPFIAPELFQKYQNVTPSAWLPGGNVVDEWSLSVAMLNDTSEGGGIEQIEQHYKTFIVSP